MMQSWDEHRPNHAALLAYVALDGPGVVGGRYFAASQRRGQVRLALKQLAALLRAMFGRRKKS